MITTQIKYTDSIPPYFIIDYEISDEIQGNSDSTSLIELSLYDFTKSDYLNSTPKTINGECKILNLNSIGVSCNSDNFNIRILNKNSFKTISLCLMYEFRSLQSLNRISLYHS